MSDRRLYRCRECWDESWVTVEGQLNAVRPCQACRPVQYAHWVRGGYRAASAGGWALSRTTERSAA